MKDDKIDVKIMGIKIGTCTGWDQADDFVIQWYDFEPWVEWVGRSNCLSFDPFDSGNLTSHNENGEEEWSILFTDVYVSPNP